MSYYRFTPSYSYGLGQQPYVTWKKGFNDQEINQIIEIGKSKETHRASIGNTSVEQIESGEVNIDEVRKSNTSWLKQDDCPWLYDRLGWIAQQLNGKFYDFDLWGFHEDMQFTTYDGNQEGHYDWHIDSGLYDTNNIDSRLPRKFSLSLLLSDPNDYQGGNLEIKTGKESIVCEQEKGIVIGFPSYTLHRVAPVTKGMRYSLVVWCTGPRFK